MKKSSVRKYSDPIPVDLLIDIFSRVSGKSIARFRCVSKFCAWILRLPDFTELFLTKSSTRPRLFFTVKANGKSFFYSSTQPQNPDKNSSLVATRYASFPEYFSSNMYYTHTVCGLVLRNGWTIRQPRVICNPATGGFLTLPKVLIKTNNLVEVEAKSSPTKISRILLGYDPISRQFKVLCMTSSSDERPNTHQVLTLETGKRSWRRIEHKFHFIKNFRMRGEVCLNGVLYFGAQFGQSSVIVSFDVRSEKFGFINTNKDLEVEDSSFGDSLTLFNYKGKLGIYDWDIDRDRELVLWVLEDAGNHKWSKHVYVLPDVINEMMMFVGMTSTGEIVWSSYDDDDDLSILFYVFFYNLERKTLTRVSIQGIEEFKHHDITIDTFLHYVENMKFM
ncbi:putative F-box protein At1g53360 [Eutrema salsugineum]|uniref:putative F-box protein At1g53360 n=1 Tax=Eutrema salsugineum TaxID=72664 RepID=UPI000CED7808|nr:putative F-box protein At1g53360 [Eutrema salsugineum]